MEQFINVLKKIGRLNPDTKTYQFVELSKKLFMQSNIRNQQCSIQIAEMLA
jgi:hypothetical protein